MANLAGAEAIAEDHTSVRMREGPNLNRAIVTFSNLSKALAGLLPRSVQVTAKSSCVQFSNVLTGVSGGLEADPATC